MLTVSCRQRPRTQLSHARPASGFRALPGPTDRSRFAPPQTTRFGPLALRRTARERPSRSCRLREPLDQRSTLVLGHAEDQLGTVDEVLTSAALTELYGTRVEVLRMADPSGDGPDRVFVAGVPEHGHHHQGEDRDDDEVARLERSA